MPTRRWWNPSEACSVYRSMLRSVLLGVVLAGVLAGCSLGGGSGQSGSTGGSLGALQEGSGKATVIVSGLVVVEGGPPPLSGQSPSGVRPVKYAAIRITGRSAVGGRVVRKLTCDEHGRFRIDLPPGRYAVVAKVFRSATQQPGVESVVVNDGQTTRVRITGSLT
jgi:hypothetical protein